MNDDGAPRHDDAAERAVLGSILLGGTDVLDEVRQTGIRPEHFYQPRHEELLRICGRLAAAGGAIDAQTLLATMTVEEMRHCGGGDYLLELVQAGSYRGMATVHAQLVIDCAVLRALEEAGRRTVQFARTAPLDRRREALEQARAALDAVEAPEERTTLHSAPDLLPRVLDGMEAEKVYGVSTGLPELDDYLAGGMGPGHTIVVGARPSVGKSMLGCHFAMAACRRGVPTALFSHEMTSIELMQRMLSCESGVPLTNIRLGKLNEDQWGAVARATDRINQWPLVIDDEARMTIADYRARLRKLTRRRKAGLIVSDYVQLVRPLDPRLPREQQVSQTSAGAKALAKDFGVPFVILAQLSRATEARKDAVPVLSDLRESGSLENDADTVMLLHARGNEMEIHVAKNRHGQTGSALVGWNPKIMRVGS